MDLEFNQVTYDGDLEDASADQLRDLVEQYENAQESNAAEFEAAKETIEEVGDVNVAEFKDAREDLIEEIEEFDAFEESPLVDEDDLEDAEFSKLRTWREHFAEEDADEESESEFDDMGHQAPTDDDDETEEFAEDILGDMPGVNL